ncbi:ACP phosphodiesterase [Neiella marina]|uniref:ACP phosphodiesterase n=1 Tax=Neiella marina TaxID=508461 RepID=A0A8J2XML8_9GAMM|nr:ACP phosphodiesterase [Neiella marina]GGA65856.1 ACP phosphodiesterase [Neiella marina]
MNFLAHFHIASATQTSITGALLGDFVRGNQYLHFSPDVQLGILLHRKVDAYSDRMPYLASIRPKFKQGQRRYLGIVTDMLLDHKLSQHWSEFCSTPLTTFAHCIYQQLTPLPHMAPRYEKVRAAMSEGNWLCHYQSEEQVLYALNRISLRLKRQVDLADIGALCLQYCRPELERAITQDYPELMTQLTTWLDCQTAN